ncbi:MAG: cytochrome c oxidase subunit II [Planctomycetaceae bacterium]|nr:cytochrome c oxidase subunit II [Planctomycetaceae bacterium]
MKRFWCLFFMLWPLLAIYVCWIAPDRGWWFPTDAMSPLGQRIDDLFYMILIVTTVTFIFTQIGLGYVLWTGAQRTDPGNTTRAWFSHGSHNLEVIWSIVPAAILLYIALYQFDVWREFRMKPYFPQAQLNAALNKVGVDVAGKAGATDALAEVTARQFEWRIRYAGFDQDGKLLPLMSTPQPTDLYAVNDLHLPSGAPVMIHLRSQDVQHSFFLPELRVKQDAVPGLVIPVWFEASESATYNLLCAELCGWGHYKMKARFVAEPSEDFLEWLRELHAQQNFDGVAPAAEEAGAE